MRGRGFLKYLLSVLGAMAVGGFNTVAAQAATYKQAEYIMGTVFEITLDSQRPLTDAERGTLFKPLFAHLRAHDQHLSNYRQDSELSRLVQQMKQAKQGSLNPSYVTVSPMLCGAISRARHYHKATAGAFDITVGPLVQLWGFKNQRLRVPSAQEITQALDNTGFRAFHFDATRCEVHQLPTVDNPLDFGAMGKGMAIDAAIDYWVAHLKPLHPLLSGLAIHGGGSSAYFWGTPAATPQGWPVIPRQGQTVYWLKNQALSVSGLKEKYGVYQGRVYGHIIDPRNGYALSGPEQLQRGEVYVVADRAELADVFSTTLWVVDDAQARQLARTFNFRFWWEQPSSAAPSRGHYPVVGSSSGD